MKLRFFCSRIVIEIPHFASLRGKEREIKILRSNNGEKWEEHPIVATDEAVQKALNESLEGRWMQVFLHVQVKFITGPPPHSSTKILQGM